VTVVLNLVSGAVVFVGKGKGADALDPFWRRLRRARARIQEAARELATTAATEEYEGKRQQWSQILEGELGKARDIQYETAGVNFRELEQAVFATFLHSQPIGQKASLRDLILAVGATRPDRIELEKALRGWASVSWFLDDAELADAKPGTEAKPLPKVWRLGSRPNLKQMHFDACKNRVKDDLVEAKLLTEIGKLKSLTAGAREAGAKVHVLPERPKDIEDDGEFHYVLLGPTAVSSSGNPSAEARRYLDEKTGPEAPRVYRNAVVLATPSREGLEVSRGRIRDYLGWEEVQHQLKDQDVDPLRQETLAMSLEAAKKKIPEAVLMMYGIIVTVSDKNDAQAFKLTVNPGEPLFNQIKADERSRIRDTAVASDALLPEGPFNLWRSGETSRRVKDLVGAFTQFPHLPKMLRRKEILDTLLQGGRDGIFVLRVTNPDRTARTFWRQEPDDAALKGPKAERPVIEVSMGTAVQEGKLWLIAGPASLCGEPVPAGVLTTDARLLTPPLPIPPTDLRPEPLPGGWNGDTATGSTLFDALSQKVGKPLPWPLVKTALNAAFRTRMLERTVDSGPWPCDAAGAASVRVRLPGTVPPPPPPPPPPGVLRAEADLQTSQLQDLADQMGELKKLVVGYDLKLHLRIELGGARTPPADLVARINAVLEEVAKGLRFE